MVGAELLSTSEAARLAGVGASSVKRWADDGALACVRTAGGHRRFPRAAVERLLLAQASGGGAAPGGGAAARLEPGRDRASTRGAVAASPWVEVLLRAGEHGLQAALLEARGRLGAWYRVADEVGAALGELGARWRRRELFVLDEHLASERLARALARVTEAMPTVVVGAAAEARGPRCLLACPAGEEHTLGLALAELCLAEAGWSALWTGRRTPVAEIVRAVERGVARMVALSASACSGDAATLAADLRRIERACRRAGVAVAIGGRGAWPDRPLHAQRFHDFAAFHRFAVTWRARW